MQHNPFSCSLWHKGNVIACHVQEVLVGIVGVYLRCIRVLHPIHLIGVRMNTCRTKGVGFTACRRTRNCCQTTTKGVTCNGQLLTFLGCSFLCSLC